VWHSLCVLPLAAFKQKNRHDETPGGISHTKHIVYDKRHAPSVSTAVTRIPRMALPGVSKPVTWAEPFRNIEDVIVILSPDSFQNLS